MIHKSEFKPQKSEISQETCFGKWFQLKEILSVLVFVSCLFFPNFATAKKSATLFFHAVLSDFMKLNFTGFIH